MQLTYLKSKITRPQWQLLSEHTLNRAKGKCEKCEKASDELTVREIWEKQENIVVFKRMSALCPACQQIEPLSMAYEFNCKKVMTWLCQKSPLPTRLIHSIQAIYEKKQQAQNLVEQYATKHLTYVQCESLNQRLNEYFNATYDCLEVECMELDEKLNHLIYALTTDIGSAFFHQFLKDLSEKANTDDVIKDYILSFG